MDSPTTGQQQSRCTRTSPAPIGRSMLSRVRSRMTVSVHPSPSAASGRCVVDSHLSRTWPTPAVVVDRVRGDSLVRNSLFVISTTIVNLAFGFFYWLLAARLFNAEVVGLTAALVSASTIVLLLASLGVGGTLIQSLAGEEKSAGWSTTFWAGMATAVVSSVVIVGATVAFLPLVVAQLDALHVTTYLLAFAIGTVTMTAGGILDYVFIAERATGNMLSRNSVVAATKVLMVVLFTAAAGTRALNLLDAWAAASVVGLAVGAGLLMRRVRLARPPRPAVLIRQALEVRSLVAGHQLIGMGAALLPCILPVLVTARLSARDNAYFFSTWMVAGVFLIISPALSVSLFAECAHSPNELDEKARSALVIMGAILIPCIVGVLALGGLLLSAFGPAYEHHALGLLRIVLFASIPDAVTNVYVAVLRVRGRLAAAAGLNIGMGVGTVALSWLLLPALGISAVGWAFLAMQLCGCVYVFFDRLRVPHSSQARLGLASPGSPERAGNLTDGTPIR